MKGEPGNSVDPAVPQTPVARKAAGEHDALRKDVDEAVSEFLNELNHLSVALESPQQQNASQKPGDKQVTAPPDRAVEKGLALRTGESTYGARPASRSAYLDLILSQRRDDSRARQLVNPATHATLPVPAPSPPVSRQEEGPGTSDTSAHAAATGSTVATGSPGDQDETRGSPPPATASAASEPFLASLDLSDSGRPRSHSRLAIALAAVTAVAVALAGYHFLRPGPTPAARQVVSDAPGSPAEGIKSTEESRQDVDVSRAQPEMPITFKEPGPTAVQSTPRDTGTGAAAIPKLPANPERGPADVRSQDASAGSPGNPSAGTERKDAPVRTTHRDSGSQPEPAKPGSAGMPVPVRTEPSVAVSATLEPALVPASLPSPTQTLNASPRPPSVSAQLLIPVTGASGDRHAPSGAKPISGATPEEESSAARASILAASAIGVTSPATVISKVMPEYPRQARATHIGGNVVVIVEVDDQGKVVKATAVSGPKVLRTAAEAALLKWRFKPAVQNGINVSSRVSIGVLFQ